MDRKLTLELLRIVVAQKLHIAPNQTWKAAHWDRLEGYFQDVVLAQKAKWRGERDGDGKQIAAPDIKTAKDFLHLSEEKILQIRASASDRVGIPSINTQDYLVRILGLSFDKLRDFEACVTAMGLHPDVVKAENINLLDRITAHLQQNASEPIPFPKTGTRSQETEQAAAMDDDAVERNHNSTTDPFAFELPEELNDASELEQSRMLASQAPTPSAKHRKQLLKLTVFATIAASATVIAILFGSGNSPIPQETSSKPILQISTSGANSPIIHNTEGDVHYWVGSLNQDTTDTSTHAK